MSGLIIGLTGKRQVGKSKITEFLMREHGFVKIHPFNGGKAACRALYQHYGVSAEDAFQMTDGDLKDTPCEKLPGGVASRKFMEDFGRFMGVEMGPEWTLGKEIELALERDPDLRIIAESIAYEEPMLRAMGAHVFGITRLRSVTQGFHTDKAVEQIVTDGDFANNFDTLEEMHPALVSFLADYGIDLNEVEDVVEMTV